MQIELKANLTSDEDGLWCDSVEINGTKDGDKELTEAVRKAIDEYYYRESQRNGK